MQCVQLAALAASQIKQLEAQVEELEKELAEVRFRGRTLNMESGRARRHTQLDFNRRISKLNSRMIIRFQIFMIDLSVMMPAREEGS